VESFKVSVIAVCAALFGAAALAAPKMDCKASGPGGKWYKAASDFRGGWCTPTANQILPAGLFGAQATVYDRVTPLVGSRTFQCTQLPDGTAAWVPVSATCSRLIKPTRTEATK
jgi:hypothetical protein